MRRHQNADVLIALAEGKAIQFKNNEQSGWQDWLNQDQVNRSSLRDGNYPNPLLEDASVEWRIKIPWSKREAEILELEIKASKLLHEKIKDNDKVLKELDDAIKRMSDKHK